MVRKDTDLGGGPDRTEPNKTHTKSMTLGNKRPPKLWVTDSTSPLARPSYAWIVEWGPLVFKGLLAFPCRQRQSRRRGRGKETAKSTFNACLQCLFFNLASVHIAIFFIIWGLGLVSKVIYRYINRYIISTFSHFIYTQCWLFWSVLVLITSISLTQKRGDRSKNLS